MKRWKTSPRRLKEHWKNLQNAFVSLSAKNPPSFRDNPELAITILKNKLLTLEKTLTEKDILRNFL